MRATLLAIVAVLAAGKACEPKNKMANCNKAERKYARKYLALEEEAQTKELSRLRGLAGAAG